jgi:hypothetical protein
MIVLCRFFTLRVISTVHHTKYILDEHADVLDNVNVPKVSVRLDDFGLAHNFRIAHYGGVAGRLC